MLNLVTTQKAYKWAKNPQSSRLICQIGAKTHNFIFKTPENRRIYTIIAGE